MSLTPSENLGADLDQANAHVAALEARIGKLVAQPAVLAGRLWQGDTSIGRRLFIGTDETPERLLTDADRAMYQHKQQRRAAAHNLAAAAPAGAIDNQGMRARRQQLSTLVRHPEFARGGREMVGLALGIGAWGLVTGMAMVKTGLPTWAAVLMSLTVFAGTAQLAAAPLMASGAPIWVVWATALCLNLRFVIFSSQWRPYFAAMPLKRRALMSYFTADLNYVLFMRRFPEPKPAPEQIPYFWGGVLVNASSWHLMSLLGITLGHHIPPEWGLGFAGTLALLAMTYSMLADRATWLPALVAGAAAVAAYALPLKLNMLVAIAAAVAMGTIIDHSRPLRGAGR